MSMTTLHIWNPATGITDIEVPWQELAATEITSIQKIWAEQKERLKGTSQLTQFTDRLCREWAIETGIIENLYQIERGITQTLIERGFHAEFLTHGSTNKPTSYVINLLRDQKDALEGVFDFIKQHRPLSTSYIKELHHCLVRSQETSDALDPSGRHLEIPLLKGEWKMQPNFPSRGGIQFAYCPPEHVASEMDRLVQIHTTHSAEGVPPEVEAAWLHHRVSQIHPFQDGNGRVCRALASMVLVKAGLFPLVVTRDDKDKYWEALEAADNGNLKPLVELVAALQRHQFRKATALSENILSAGADIASMLEGLMKKAEKTKQTREEEKRRVFRHAEALEEETQECLRNITDSLQKVLLTASTRSNAFTSRSTAETSHYFRAQILEVANKHLHYFADMSVYRSWVALNLVWDRKARLVFAFHGIGRPNSGSLVCAPFFEFRDSDDEQTLSTVVPVTDEAFVFFNNETLALVQQRFQPWRDNVIRVALKQLGESL